MTGFIVSVFRFRNRVPYYNEAFEGLELGEGKPSRPVLRGPGGRKAVWLLGSKWHDQVFWELLPHGPLGPPRTEWYIKNSWRDPRFCVIQVDR